MPTYSTNDLSSKKALSKKVKHSLFKKQSKKSIMTKNQIKLSNHVASEAVEIQEGKKNDTTEIKLDNYELTLSNNLLHSYYPQSSNAQMHVQSRPREKSGNRAFIRQKKQHESLSYIKLGEPFKHRVDYDINLRYKLNKE